MVEVGKCQSFITSNDRLRSRIDLAKSPEQLRQCRRQILDNGAALIVPADRNPPARAGHSLQHLIETAVELTRHFASSPPLPLRPPAL
jgi:hypothetical protein